MRYQPSSPIITIVSFIAIVSAHSLGVYQLATYSGKKDYLVTEGGATALTLHHVNLMGDDIDGALTDEEVVGDADNQDENAEPIEELPEELEKPDEDTPEIPEEIEEEEVIDEPEVEDEVVEEEIVEEEVIEEAPAEAIIATEKQEESAPKVVKQEPVKQAPEPKPEPKPIPKPQPKPQPKPTPPPKPKPALASNKIFSESELTVLNKPMPSYPRQAARRRMHGTVTVVISINENGSATNARVERSSGHDVLDREAIKAGQRIRLNPYRINGQAVAINVRVSYVFQL